MGSQDIQVSNQGHVVQWRLSGSVSFRAHLKVKNQLLPEHKNSEKHIEKNSRFAQKLTEKKSWTQDRCHISCDTISITSVVTVETCFCCEWKSPLWPTFSFHYHGGVWMTQISTPQCIHQHMSIVVRHKGRIHNMTASVLCRSDWTKHKNSPLNVRRHLGFLTPEVKENGTWRPPACKSHRCRIFVVLWIFLLLYHSSCSVRKGTGSQSVVVCVGKYPGGKGTGSQSAVVCAGKYPGCESWQQDL